MMDASNPTATEIREWAYLNNDWPDGDWDLFLSWTGYIELFLEFSIDHQCLNQRFFLHMLYFCAGKAYTAPERSDGRDLLREYLGLGETVKHGDIRQWRRLVEALQKGEMQYTYDDWEGGRLSGYEFKDRAQTIMTKILSDQKVTYLDPVHFIVHGAYSMPIATQILEQLEQYEDCEITDQAWKTSGYGNLVEVGIPVKIGNIVFEIMCSYEDIFLKRISGNKDTFYALCEEIGQMDFDAN